MTNTATNELDLSVMPIEALLTSLRGMVALRKDRGFLRRERVDVEAMTEQADHFYAEIMFRGLTATQIAYFVPGVEVFS